MQVVTGRHWSDKQNLYFIREPEPWSGELGTCAQTDEFLQSFAQAQTLLRASCGSVSCPQTELLTAQADTPWRNFTPLLTAEEDSPPELGAINQAVRHAPSALHSRFPELCSHGCVQQLKLQARSQSPKPAQTKESQKQFCLVKNPCPCFKSVPQLPGRLL